MAQVSECFPAAPGWHLERRRGGRSRSWSLYCTKTFFFQGQLQYKNLLLYFDFKRGIISHSILALRKILKGVNGR